MTTKPSAAARAWDAAALALVVGGAAVYAQAGKGMQALLGPQERVPTVGSVHVEKWLHFRSMSNLGIGLVTAGVLIGVVSFFRSRREIAALAAPEIAGSGQLAAGVPPNVPQE